MSDLEHIVTVSEARSLGPGAWAECECGWRGIARDTRSEAYLDADEHLMDARYGKIDAAEWMEDR